MDYAKESLRLHGEWKGKIEVKATVPVGTKDDLSLAYTPGVAQPCLEIQKDIEKSYELTRRWNLCAVITDGSAVLGLGDIGPEAGMPVMEGKCVLFKSFGDVDAFPLCVKTKDVDEFVQTVYNISGSFGGINLEDIAAPRCFEIERKLKEKCDIPIFHDDQHGTAVITLAGLTNALKVVGKKKEDVRVVVNGAGACDLVTLFLRFLTVKSLSFPAASTASACSLFSGLNFFPLKSFSAALKGAAPSFSRSAVTFQYSLGTNAAISRSRSTTISSATD